MGDRRGRRGRVIAAVAAIVVVSAAVALAVTATRTADTDVGEQTPAPLTHVHLGDSFAAGTGTSPLVEDSPFVCQRSEHDFGQLIAERRGHRLTDVSCAGAWTRSLYEAQYEGVAPQLEAVTPDTDLVTLTLGGNDATLYSTLVGQCSSVAAQDPTGAPCRAELGARPARSIDDEIGPDVRRALRDIRARAPHARIVLAGDPWLTPTAASCRPALTLADGDIAYVRRTQARLNAVLAKAAEATGTVFVDMAERSDGHDACAPKGTRWIEPMVGADTSIVMHPNVDGQRAIADAVEAVL